MFNKEDIKKLAKLANLPIKESEYEKFASQLSEIISYVKQLERIDSNQVEPTFNVTGLKNINWGDKVEPSLTQKKSLQNAKMQRNGFFVTKGIFNE